MADTLFGVPLKLVSLVTLTVQNSSLILVMHYSRIMTDAKGRYFTSTAVLLNEVVKLIISFCVASHQQGMRSAVREAKMADLWKMSIPAIIYTLQNSLQYLAVSNLDAATFQVTYQLKILTTAFFAVTMLHRRLSGAQWLCLVFLTVGIALVQMPAETFDNLIWGSSAEEIKDQPKKTRAVEEAKDMNPSVGLIAVLIACALSGLAGIYFEKVLKGTKQVSIWVRNMQLAVFSIIPALFIGVLAVDGEEIRQQGFFHGYNGVVWLTILLQAGGGIIVSVCVKYADNLAKNFATSISILLSFLASVYFFDYTVTVNYVVGASIVVAVTYAYSVVSERPSPPSKEYVELESQSNNSSGSTVVAEERDEDKRY